MNTVVVRMSGMAVSSQRNDVLATYSLGSCLGIAMHDAVAGMGGMIHCMLPDSTIHAAKATERPCMFVDTGVPLLLREFLSAGSRREDLVVRAAGASCMMPDEQAFMIGRRNREACLSILGKNGLTLSASSVGGNSSRSISLDISTGRLVVRQHGRETEI